jgi:uncharacterized damage-inducible protein DinB
MSALTLFSQMARNNAWSNDRILGAACQLSQDAFTAPRTGFFPSLRLTLGHIYLADLFFLDALTQGGRGREVFQEGEPETASELRELQAKADTTLIAFCDQGFASDATVLFGWSGGPATERVEAALLQLFQHQIHHRGQAHAMLSGTDVAPPPLDEFFPGFERPASATRYWDMRP